MRRQAVALLDWLKRFKSPVTGFGSLVETARGQVLPPVQAAMVGVLQEPSAQLAAARIELGGIAIDLQKHVLHHVLGFRAVAYNAHRSVENEPLVPLEEHRTSILRCGMQDTHHL